MQERRKRVRINYKDSEGSDVYSIIDDIPSDTSREHLTALKIHYSNGAIETASLDEKYEMLLLNSWEKNQPRIELENSLSPVSSIQSTFLGPITGVQWLYTLGFIKLTQTWRSTCFVRLCANFFSIIDHLRMV